MKTLLTCILCTTAVQSFSLAPSTSKHPRSKADVQLKARLDTSLTNDENNSSSPFPSNQSTTRRSALQTFLTVASVSSTLPAFADEANSVHIIVLFLAIFS